MANNKILEQMLEHLVNDEQQKAEELFHEFVVAKSREIYEGLVEEELDDEEGEDEDEDKKKDEEVDENFEDIAIEADDDMGDMGGDPTDDLESELSGDEEEDGEQSEEEIMQDLGDIIDELQAKFDALQGEEEDQGEFGGDDMGGDDMDMGGDKEMKDEFDLETVREYVEKVPAGHGAEKKGQGEKADGSATGLKFQKNDMGGTSANILSGKDGQDGGYPGAGSTIKGSSLLKGKPQLQDGGNVNTPGAKNGNAFSTKEPGHGAEKAGSKESADKGAAGLFRGRR
jgi:hypothetical protein